MSDPPLASPTAIMNSSTSPNQSLASIANESVELPPLDRERVDETNFASRREEHISLDIIQHPDRALASDSRRETILRNTVPVVPATLAELQMQDEEGRLIEGNIVPHAEYTLPGLPIHDMTIPVHVDIDGSGTIATVFAFDQIQVPHLALGNYHFRLSLYRLPTEITNTGTFDISAGVILTHTDSHPFRMVPWDEFQAQADIMTPMSLRMLNVRPSFYRPADPARARGGVSEQQ
ncbi:hypothetical protein DFH28DRAFT_1050068 [Melampsora americana]|nr:hypothetical protein DFH28DRAFT_1050068 [Melampsora americana]